MSQPANTTPVHCPVCEDELHVTRLQCPSCGTEVAGNFALGRLTALREPHATVIELFLRSRGNLKEMERELGLSYPTVRARVEEALESAGLTRRQEDSDNGSGTEERSAVLDALERGEIGADEARERLSRLSGRRMS